MICIITIIQSKFEKSKEGHALVHPKPIINEVKLSKFTTGVLRLDVLRARCTGTIIQKEKEANRRRAS